MSGKYIQERREQLGLSQRQFAQIYGINFRTLQDYEQGRKPVESIKGDVLLRISKGLGCSIEDILIEDSNNRNVTNKDNHLAEYYRRIQDISLYGKYYKFPIIVDNKNIDMSRIHPLKQKVVSRINDELMYDTGIASIMLFGSSVMMRCNQNSDIDLAIRLQDDFVNEGTKNTVSEKIQEVCDWNADILWFDRISRDDRIYHDICKGVQIV